jgi:cytochrome P450
MPDGSLVEILPPLAGTAPAPAKPLSFFSHMRATNGNSFEAAPQAAYEQPLYWQRSMFGSVLFISDPEGVRRVLVDNVANYPKTELSNRFFSAMFGEGLLSSDGARWRTHRRVMAPSFDPRSIAAYAPAMAETALAFAKHWVGLGEGADVDIAREMKHLTLQIICQTMFSSDADELVEVAGGTLEAVQDALNFTLLDFAPVIGPPRMKAKHDFIHARFSAMDAAIYRMIAAREQNLEGAGRDLLTRLVEARDPENGAGLSASEVRDEVITIFMAGHETTAVTMTWVWYLLSQRPAAEAKLHAELDAVLAGRPVAAADLPSLVYARMVIEEAMRLYPPAPGLILREAKAADEICGMTVRAGTRVMVSPWVIHRHEAMWDEPLTFDPERFSAENSMERPRFAYLPFGAGPRVCIGGALAMTEATLILAALAQRFRPRLVPGQDIKLQNRITLRPADGIRMVLERRS